MKSMLQFPQKFWRVINRYYNSKRCWAQKNFTQMLEEVISEKESHMQFMEEFDKLWFEADVEDCLSKHEVGAQRSTLYFESGKERQAPLFLQLFTRPSFAGCASGISIIKNPFGMHEKWFSGNTWISGINMKMSRHISVNWKFILRQIPSQSAANTG